MQYLYPEHACVVNVPTGFVNDEEPTGRSRTLDTPRIIPVSRTYLCREGLDR